MNEPIRAAGNRTDANRSPNRSPNRRSGWVAAVVAAIVVGGVLTVIAMLWASVGDSEISAAGWVALVIGVLVALGVGIGLMALVFFSSRGGYDEP
jgi:quinol-cytochrome oxidoreductase complex cytochrome b subunit